MRRKDLLSVLTTVPDSIPAPFCAGFHSSIFGGL